MNTPPPRTEESLQAALTQLGQARATANDAAAGEALVQLAYLVKWVRSDNDDPPFVRSHTLALEALEIFRRLGDARGECAALLAAAPLEMLVAGEPSEQGDKAETMLVRAQSLATQCGDALLQARAVAARARHLNLIDRAQARPLTAQALAMFRVLGDARGVAGCLLSTALQTDDLAQKRDHALEALRIFRQIGATPEVGVALTVALAGIQDPAELAPAQQEILGVLEEAISSGNQPMQDRCRGFLARIAASHRSPTMELPPASRVVYYE